MFVIKLAGIRIRIENRFPFIERQCRDYLCEGEDAAFSVSVTPDEILEEQKHGEFSDGYCESICVYRHICEILPSYNIFLMHSSVKTRRPRSARERRMQVPHSMQPLGLRRISRANSCPSGL